MRAWFLGQWREQRVASIFVVMALVFGGLFMILTPLTQSADETTHFYRAYQLSEGHVFSQSVEQGYGASLPRDTYVVTRQLFGDIPSHYERTFNYHQVRPLLGRKLDSHDRIPVHLEGATVYSPVGYIPQIIAIWLGRLLWPSVALMYYLGRFINLLVWIALVYGAIRLWPSNKWAVFALALLPMSISQAASFSPDALTNGLAIFITAGALHLAASGRKLSHRQIALCFVLLILVSLCKPVFFGLGLLAFALKPKQLGGLKPYALFVGSLLGGALVVTALWNIPVEKYSLAIQHYYLPGQNISRPEQMHFIVTHPLSFVMVLARTFLTNTGDVVARSFVGRLAWWDVDLPLWMISFAYVLLLLAFVARDAKDKLLAVQSRWASLLTFAVSFVLINTALYLTVTEVKSPIVTGVQGRYFIPIALLLAAGLGGWIKITDWQKTASRLFPLGYAVLLMSSLLVMVNRFI